MDFRKLHNQLVSKGYNDDTANAKIAPHVAARGLTPGKSEHPPS